MTPLEKLRQGIVTSDTTMLIDGYCCMTGEDPDELTLEVGAEDNHEESVEFPKTAPKKKRATKKKATKKRTKKKATKKTTKRATKKKTAKKAPKVSQKGFVIKTEPKKPEGVAGWTGENLFESMMGFEEEMTEEEAKALRGINSEIASKETSEYQEVEMQCKSCKKMKSVNPAYINPGSRFVCDPCLSKKKG